MKNTLKSFLIALLILSTQSISMEVEPEYPRCVCNKNAYCPNQIEDKFFYYPLFRMSNREQKPTTLYFDIVFEMSNNLIKYLYALVDFESPYPTAYVYLKMSGSALKGFNDFVNCTVSDKLVLCYTNHPRRNWGSERGILRCSSIINGLSIDDISAQAFETQLPLHQVMSPSLMKGWTIRVSTIPIQFQRGSCECTSKILNKSIIETGKFEACEIGTLLSFDPFDLKIVNLSAPGTKIFMYPKFDFVESFSHIKDIFLINPTDMVYIINPPYQDVPKEVWELIIKTYFSLVRDEFHEIGKMIYQTNFENIKDNLKDNQIG